MQLRTWLYLKDVVKYGDQALEFAGSLGTDEMRYLAIERMLFIVGEAVTASILRESDVQDLLTNTIDIRKFRNLLAHGYFKVDRSQVIKILREDLPTLIREAASIPEPSDD